MRSCASLFLWRLRSLIDPRVETRSCASLQSRTVQDINKTIEAVWRMESAKLIASLTRVVRDVGLAEDLAQDALVTAIERWPETGVPDNPAAWLMTTAKHRAIDQLRRSTRFAEMESDVARELEHQFAISRTDPDDALDNPINDDVLRLIFLTCHPLLTSEAQVALTLRLVGALTTEEIARAFLQHIPTIAQRIVRAKKTLAEARVPFELPVGPALKKRLTAVLNVIYLIFNEGYAASSGDDWIRPALCDDAMRLGRVLAGQMPEEMEVHGLLALMEIHASRLRARTNTSGEPILLLDQDRAKWDFTLITHGLGALERAEALARKSDIPLGAYTLQAEIAACHARARTAQATDWQRIVAFYDALAVMADSPVVELNRAVAVSMAYGPSAALEIVDELRDEPSLIDYHLLPSVRGDLLFKLARFAEAKIEFETAAALAKNPNDVKMLERRAEECAKE
jgi:RNA polymerase sigma factor (sigma-70 family)